MNAAVDKGFQEFEPRLVTAHNELYAALAKAQAEFAPIRRERLVTVTMKSGGKYTFAYAPLEVILRAVSPALAKHGLAMTQAVVEDCVETRLVHGAGQQLSNRVKIINADGGAQAYGSALTYARRYGITLLLCVCADDDDDANASEGNTTEVKKEIHSPKGDLGQNIPVDHARRVALEMLAIIDKPAADGDHDELKKAMSALDYHERVLNPDADLYVAVGEQLPPAKRNVWKALVKKAQVAESADRAISNAGRKF